MLILTDRLGREIRYINEQYKIDIDLNDSMDFEIKIPADSYSQDFVYGSRVFVPDTEYGGIIGSRKVSTKETEITLGGTSWRGFIKNKIIEPTLDYRVVSGELNTIIRNLFNEYGLTPLFEVSAEDTEISVSNYQFNRFDNLYDGLVKMLLSVDYRFNLTYIQGEEGLLGRVFVEAVPIMDYSETIELSQNQQLNFSFSSEVTKCNHLIALGKGELRNRQRIDLFVQEDGSIGDTQYYFGLNEVVEIYDYSNVEGETTSDQLANLRKSGIEKLTELTNKSSFTMDLSELELNVNIGDIVGGRDYITGMSMSQPIWNKIYVEENGVTSVSYELKGDDQEKETIIQ